MEGMRGTIKLPLFAVLKDTALTLAGQSRLLLARLWLLAVLLIGVQFALAYLPAPDDWSDRLLHGAVNGAFFTLFAITCHRVILLGPESVSRLGELRWSSREWRYAWWSLVAYFYLAFMVYLAMNAVPLVGRAIGLGYSAVMWKVLFWLAMLPGFYVFTRISILFPAAAVESNVGWDQAFDMTQGNGWRLVVLTGGVALMFDFLQEFISGPGVLEQGLVVLLALVAMVCEIVILSVSFKHLSQSTGEGF